MQGATKNTSIRINVNLLDKANQQGLNLSKWKNVKVDKFLNGKLTIISNNDGRITRELVINMSDGFKALFVANRNDKNGFPRTIHFSLIQLIGC